MISLIPFSNISDEEWDNLIIAYESKTLFHHSAWLRFIGQTQNAEVARFKIVDGDNLVGYFAALIEKKGPFKVFSSPRQGYNTPYMGPIVNSNYDQAGFINALEEYCKTNCIDQLEISSIYLDPLSMRRNGYSCSKKGVTCIVGLSEDESLMWGRLDRKSCRSAIHQAEHYNLAAEEADDAEVITEYYQQLKEVFARQHLALPYRIDRVKTLFDCLRREDKIFAMRVKYNNQTIATGLFPHDDKMVYFFGGASWRKYQYLRPNDLLHWAMMKTAGRGGILKYDMGGGGNFKAKFGGKEIELYRWSKSFNLLTKIARSIYKIYAYFPRCR